MTRKPAPVAPAEPPEHLSGKSKALWRAVVFREVSPGRLQLICTALEALDRAEEARLLIAKTGLITKTGTTGVVHASPLLKIERENRGLFARIWGELHLSWDPLIDGRTN